MADIAIEYNMVKGMIQLIDVCAKRGAFEGPELEQVGHLRRDLMEAAADEINAEAEEVKKQQAANSKMSEKFQTLPTEE